MLISFRRSNRCVHDFCVNDVSCNSCLTDTIKYSCRIKVYFTFGIEVRTWQHFFVKRTLSYREHMSANIIICLSKIGLWSHIFLASYITRELKLLVSSWGNLREHICKKILLSCRKIKSHRGLCGPLDFKICIHQKIMCAWTCVQIDYKFQRKLSRNATSREMYWKSIWDSFSSTCTSWLSHND